VKHLPLGAFKPRLSPYLDAAAFLLGADQTYFGPFGEAATHVKAAHGIKEITPEIAAKVRGVMRDDAS
jgi:Protein of unknown function (DUF1059)